MPDLNEFFNEPVKESQSHKLEEINGVRPCSKCDEDVAGALWDPIEMVMSWRCSSNHDTVFKVG